MNSQDVLKCLDSTKFLEILQSNKTPNKFGIDQLKINFKYLNFVCEAFKICSKIRTPPGSEHLNFRIFSFILNHKYQTIYFDNKTSYFEPLGDVGSDFKFVQFFFIVHSV